MYVCMYGGADNGGLYVSIYGGVGSGLFSNQSHIPAFPFMIITIRILHELVRIPSDDRVLSLMIK